MIKGASTKHAQQVKCGTGLDTIIIQYSTMLSKGKKKPIFLLLYSHNGEWLKYIFYIIFKGKKLMQWLESSYSSKVLASNLFLNM